MMRMDIFLDMCPNPLLTLAHNQKSEMHQLLSIKTFFVHQVQ